MNENTVTRPRGCVVYPMPEKVCGPLDSYALLVRDNSEGLQCRMVHTEGVAYLVTPDKPWRWNDYDPGATEFSMDELIKLIDVSKETDLADWIRTFGARLESNFAMVYAWGKEGKNKVYAGHRRCETCDGTGRGRDGEELGCRECGGAGWTD